MESGLDKCITAIVKHGKLIKSQNISLNRQTVIRDMELDDLGKEEGEGAYNQMKDKLGKEYYCQVWQILMTELNLKNKIIAVNTSAVPALVYSYGIVE
jgi:hypothetical protein